MTSHCRPSWDEYFLGIATAVAERSDCDRSKVGAVVVKDRRIRGTGYNGSPSGMPGCGTCPRRTASVSPGETSYDDGPGRCVAVHAEANALLYCDREDLVGATLYITREPCCGCQKLIDASGVSEVLTPDRLADKDALAALKLRSLFGLPTFSELCEEREAPLIQSLKEKTEMYGEAWAKVFDLAMESRDLGAPWWDILEASH